MQHTRPIYYLPSASPLSLLRHSMLMPTLGQPIRLQPCAEWLAWVMGFTSAFLLLHCPSCPGILLVPLPALLRAQTLNARDLI